MWRVVMIGVGCCISILLSLSSRAETGYVPDEFESVGGHGLGLGNAGMAAVSGQSSVRTNPAMMGFEKQYRVSAGYHWPTHGREFYQAGVVDSRTSKVAAGVLYSQALKDYAPTPIDSPEFKAMSLQERAGAVFDSPVKRRIAFGIGQPVGSVGVGVGGQFVEFFDAGELKKGTTAALGLAGLLTKSLRFGLSAENLANRKVRAVAPRVYRAGIAYTLLKGNVTAHLDFRQRQRVAQEAAIERETFMLISATEPEYLDLERPERMATASFSARVQDMVRLMAGFSKNLDGPERSSISGGVALVNGTISLSYLVSKPYSSIGLSHQAINLSMNVTI